MGAYMRGIMLCFTLALYLKELVKINYSTNKVLINLLRGWRVVCKEYRNKKWVFKQHN